MTGKQRRRQEKRERQNARAMKSGLSWFFERARRRDELQEVLLDMHYELLRRLLDHGNLSPAALETTLPLPNQTG